MNVLAIVPARAGSTRLPGKNRRELRGKPLVEWALDACRAARTPSLTVLSSDDEEILSLGSQYGRLDPRLRIVPRPAQLATATSPAIDYVNHALLSVEHSSPLTSASFEAIAIVQPTSPLTLGSDIDATVALLTRENVPCAASVMELDHAHHPLKWKRLEGRQLVPFLDEERGRFAHHELPKVYVRNGAVYAARRELIEAGQVIGEPCAAHVMPRERSIDINDALDLAMAEHLLAQQTTAHSGG